MNHEVLLAWLVGSALGGFGLATLWRASNRFVSGLGLGSALVLAAFILTAFRLELRWLAWAPAAAGALLGLGGLFAARGSRPSDPESLQRPARLGSLFCLAVLAAASWLAVVGAMHLDPGAPFLLEHAPMASQYAVFGDSASHPLGGGGATLCARLLGLLGGDPLATAQVLAGCFQILTLAALFGGLRQASGHALAALLGVAAILAGTPGSWLVTTGLEEAMAHLLGAGLLALIMVGSGGLVGVLAAGLVLALAPLQLGMAWPLGLLVALAPWLPGARSSRTPRWLQSAPPLLALGAVAWTQGLSGPGFEWSWWTVLGPLALVVAWRRRMRGALLLGVGELLVMALGEGLGASVLGAGCTLAVAGELLGEAWDSTRPGRWRLGRESGVLCLEVPRRLVLVLLVLFLVVEGLEPGETAVNRQVILAAHKVRVRLPELIRPLPLESWVESRGGAYGLSPQDVELARTLAGTSRPGLVLSAGLQTEPVLASSVIATLARRPLIGWIRLPEGVELEPAAELIRRRLQGQVARGERLVLLDPFPEAPILPQGRPPEAGFQARWEGLTAPGVLVGIGAGPLPPAGELLGYRVFRNGQPWGRFPVEAARGESLPFPVPRTPGTYTLEFFRRPAGEPGTAGTLLGEGGLAPLVSDEPEALAALEARVEGLGSRIPSRSLVPWTLVLRNPTARPLNLGFFESLLLEMEGEELHPYEARGELQPLLTAAGERPAVLPAGGEVRLRVLLPTPLTEGRSLARPLLVDGAGGRFPLDLEVEFQTWRRLAPAREE